MRVTEYNAKPMRITPLTQPEALNIYEFVSRKTVEGSDENEVESAIDRVFEIIRARTNDEAFWEMQGHKVGRELSHDDACVARWLYRKGVFQEA